MFLAVKSVVVAVVVAVDNTNKNKENKFHE